MGFDLVIGKSGDTYKRYWENTGNPNHESLDTIPISFPKSGHIPRFENYEHVPRFPGYVPEFTLFGQHWGSGLEI